MTHQPQLIPDQPSPGQAARDAERAEYMARLREKLKDPEFRAIEGFPIGEDEDILALSDPPYYTACPNPFIPRFIADAGRPWDSSEAYSTQPYLGELSAASRHPVYSFHPYHTKVPPDVIRTLIEHYTRPGDLVLDGFCGTGMTGVAAQEAGRSAILVDLCPVAGFISAINCRAHDWSRAISALKDIITSSRQLWGHLYLTVSGRIV